MGTTRSAPTIGSGSIGSLRALVIEDRPDDAELSMRELYRAGFRVEWERVETEQAYVQRLEAGLPDVILADYSLPQFDAMRALHILRQNALDIPFIIVSGTIGEERAVLAIQLGAADYVPKSALGRLPQAVLRALQEMRMREGRRAMERALRESETRFRSLFESSIIGILLSDPAGRITDANDVVLGILGYAREELVSGGGLRMEQLIRPENRVEIRGPGSQRWEAELVTKEGNSVPALLGFAPMKDTAGSSIWFVLDVSRLKAVEDSLRRLSGQLLRSQDEERRRIARELHDGPGQNMVALAMNLSLLEKSGVFRAHPELEKSMRQSVALAEQCAGEVRAVSYLLHPPLLDELGLSSALEAYVHGFGERTGIDISLEIGTGINRFSNEVETALFRIVQEGLSNIHRHSGSRTASLRLVRAGKHVKLELKDNGCGMPAEPAGTASAAPRRLGVGIQGMRERARQLGGRLEIHSGRSGMAVAVSLPVEP